MAKGILGKKVGMTQVFTDSGRIVPVTVIDVNPNVVLQKKTIETDGYEAVQLGFSDAKHYNKPQVGHTAKANTTPKRFVKEIAGGEMLAFEVGQSVSANIFSEGEFVDVTGTSKGKGYAGVVKRHNMHIGPKAHGSKYHRGIGGNVVGIAKLPKGRPMPGQMGAVQRTVQNLEIVKIDLDKNVILVKGNIPGATNSYVIVTNAIKKAAQPINPEALA